MKGVVFTEFLEMVESIGGMDAVDALVSLPGLTSDGAYTSVGTYDAAELLAMVDQLVSMTGTPKDELLVAFGEYLFGRFPALFPQFFEGESAAKPFLAGIDAHIHVEVRKLYPEADLPRFSHEVDSDGGLIMTYSSNRPLAAFGEGLLRGCLNHFGEELEVERVDLEPGDGTHARFTIR